MVAIIMLPSSLVLLISTIIQQIDAAPLKHETVLEAVAADKTWSPGSGAGAWQNAWPYIPAWWTTAGNAPSPFPAPPAYTGWNSPPPAYTTNTQWFTSVASETFTSTNIVYSTYTAPTSIVTIEPSPSIPEPQTNATTPAFSTSILPTTAPESSSPQSPSIASTTAPQSTSNSPTTAPESPSIAPTTFPESSISIPATNIPTKFPSTLISTSTVFSTSTVVPQPASSSQTRRRTRRPHTSSFQTTETFPTTFPFPTTSVLSTPSIAIPTIPITEISSSVVVIPSPSETTLSVSSSVVVVPTITPTSAPAPGGALSVTINNSLGSNANAYLTGVDSNGALVMLTTEGTFYTPTASSGNPEEITANVALSLNPGSNQFTIPSYISSARIWFALGTLQFSAVATSYGVGLVEPTVANINDSSESTQWAFVELTWISGYGLFANLSFVDFVGVGVGLSLTTTNAGSQSAPGMPGDGAEVVCASLKAQAASDGQPWDQLCEYDSSGGLIRVLSPGSYLSIDSSAFEGYFDDYVSQVWSQYSSQPLFINPQNSLGQISCQVSGGTLNCAGDNRGYAQPSSQDIFSCSTGPFTILDSDNDVHKAVVPRLCAAFNRATLLVDGGNVQPQVLPDQYYQSAPNNMYSKYVHSAEIDHEGYAFPYDDVAPSEQYDVAGIVASPDPTVLSVNLGG